MQKFIDDLRTEIASGRALLIVGAGISIGATRGSPAATWTGLIQLGIERCLALGRIDAERAKDLTLRLTGAPPTDDLISVAQIITRQMKDAGQGEYSRWLKETVGSLNVLESSTLKELSRLDIPVATTNYDGLLEEHILNARAICWNDTAGFLRSLRGEEKAVLHLHGYWEMPDSVVLGFRSYEDILRDNAAQAILATLPMLRTLIFVGCGQGLSDPNFKNLLDWYGRVLDRAEHRHYRLATQADVEHGRLGGGIYDVTYGASHADLPDFLRELRRASRSTVVHRSSSTHITFNLDPWIDKLSKDSALTRRISQGDLAYAKSNPALALLCPFIGQPDAEFSAQAISFRDGFQVALDSFDAFILDTMALLVLRRENIGHLKAMIKKATGSLGKSGDQNFSAKVANVVAERHLLRGTKLYDPSVGVRLIQAALEVFDKKDDDGLYRFVNAIFLGKRTVDVECLRKIREELIRHDQQISAAPSVAREYMKAARQLIEKLRLEERKRSGITEVALPHAIRIEKSLNVPYEFQTLQTPLTNLQWYELTGRHIEQSVTKPTHPFVFQIISSDGAELYESLAAEISSLVAAFRRAEGDSEYDWDVPTACEWLSAAGCEGDPFPWGRENPTPEHANLRFPDGPKSVLQPVGLYPKGRSPHGVDDCCGNVHEIVRIAMQDDFPIAFRLAGGCFQNGPHSCQYIRLFRKKLVDERRNVGIRLIRYRRNDATRREDALAQYKSIVWVRERR